MADTTIEWTDKTWNPIRGCAAVSPGCTNCYAQREAHRKSGPGGAYEGLTRATDHGPKWTGKVRVVPEKMEEPLHWRKPCQIFVNSMSDIFHKDVPDDVIREIFDTMRAAHWHQFQVLTKRPERLPEIDKLLGEWPENVWMGVSVESGDYTDRIEWLRQCGAKVKFLSLEPLLGPLPDLDLSGIDWVIAGGESGPGSRPMQIEWARDIRDQCVEQGVAFHFKQWGAFGADGVKRPKKKNGRDLDGRTWDEHPGSSALVPATVDLASAQVPQREVDLVATVETTLARLDQLTEISDLTELHRQSRALVEYLREQDKNAKTMKIAQLRIERRIGEVLSGTVRPGNPQLSQARTIGVLPHEISRNQSSKWQRLAAIPDDSFEDYLGNAVKPSLTGALRIAACEASGPVAEAGSSPSEESNSLERLIGRGEKFSTILADPPWPTSGGRGGGEMAVAEIAAFPVKMLAADVAQLHLWTTDQFLDDAIRIMKAWGFDHKSSLIWVKPNARRREFWNEGHEYLLLGTRGNAEFVTTARVNSVIKAAVGEGEPRPGLFRDLIEKVGSGPRLDLFGGDPVKDWVVPGNEYEGDQLYQGVEDSLDAEHDENSGK